MASPVATVSVQELAQRLRSPDPPVLLDCREADEWQFCRIEGSTHIPKSEIKLRVGELDPARETVVICHHGVRSRKVAEFLREQGFVRIANVTGGIDAWSLHVNPRVLRY